MNRAVIGVGSNIEPEKHVAEARQHIERQQRLLDESSFEWTQPVGFRAQPVFLNGVLLIETLMDQEVLEAWLHDLEDTLGRVRTVNKYGPRTIDLDIIVWNGQVVDEDVKQRDFLKRQVLEVMPDLLL